MNRRIWSRLANPELEAKRSLTLLVLVLITAGLYTARSAGQKPFWFDEACTVIICRLPGASEIWNALAHAADTNPPPFYFLERLGRHFVSNDQLGYRLPSILGLLATVGCLYAILAKRVDRTSALAGAAFILCTPLADYGYEARPYALMVGCVAAAILAWQCIDESKFSPVALAMALAAALSLHYYAILVWPAFALAEASILVFQRRVRAGAWIALVLGSAPLLIFGRLLLHVRQYYGRNFWARPHLTQVYSASSTFFSGDWGGAFTLVAIAVLLAWAFVKSPASGDSREDRAHALPLPVQDCVLAVGFLLLPAVSVIAARLAGGGMSPRYMLPTILGGALAVGFMTSRATATVRTLLLAVVLLSYGLSIAKNLMLGGQGPAVSAADGLVALHRESGLPVVVSDGQQYLPLGLAAASSANSGVYALVDPPAALRFAKTDSIDLALLALRQYSPLQVEEYSRFAMDYRQFILVSDGDAEWDWWPSRLLKDGNTLNLLSSDGYERIYKVVLKTDIH